MPPPDHATALRTCRTALSWLDLRGGSADDAREPGSHWRTHAWARLARSSLALWLVCATSSACLVTSAPDFSDPKTRPEIVNTVDCPAKPDLSTITHLDYQEGSYPRQEFSACIISEDLGDDVASALFIDYGKPSAISGGPYYSVVPGESVPAAALSDGPRRVSASWQPNPALTTDEGCHTVTLVVSHQFDFAFGNQYCPVNPADASTLTWFAVVCRDAANCSAATCTLASDTDNPSYCAGLPP